jgi:hypothetical protein
MLVLTDFPQEDPVEKSAERAGRDKQYWRLAFANFGFNDGLEATRHAQTNGRPRF